MDDLEMTRLCAEAMGFKFFHSKHGYWTVDTPDGRHHVCCEGWPAFDRDTGKKLPEPTAGDAILECGYAPLHNDEDAMALVNKFKLNLTFDPDHGLWRAERPNVYLNGRFGWAEDFDLARAIVKCVAKMQDAPAATKDGVAKDVTQPLNK